MHCARHHLQWPCWREGCAVAEPVINALQDVIAEEAEMGNDVAVVNHSISGMVGTSAIKGFTKKNPSRLKSSRAGYVVGVVQVTAWVLVANEVSIADMDQEFARRHPHPTKPRVVQLVVEDSDKGWSELKSDPAKAFYNDVSVEEGKVWVSKLIKFSSATRLNGESVLCRLERCADVVSVLYRGQGSGPRNSRRSGAEMSRSWRECHNQRMRIRSFAHAD